MKLLNFLIICLYYKQINSLLVPITPPPIGGNNFMVPITMPQKKGVQDLLSYKKTKLSKNGASATLLTPRSSMDSDEFEDIPLLTCEQEEYYQEFVSENNTQLILVTWNSTKVGERAVLPKLCSANNGLPLRRRCLLQNNQMAEWQKYENNITLIECRRSMFCESEPFQHYFIQNDGSLLEHQNSWKSVKIGEISSLHDMCLKTNGLHLVRKCLYDHQKRTAKWEAIDHLKDFKCLQNTRQQIISNDLNRLHDNITTSNRLNDNVKTRHATSSSLLRLLETPQKTFLPADIQLTCDIIKHLVTDQQEAELSEDILQITHNLMTVDPLVLRMSAELNATNSLLETFENYMDALTEKFVPLTQCNVTPIITTTTTTTPSSVLPVERKSLSVEILNQANIGVYAHVTKNISVFFVNPNCADISGIAIYPSKLMAQQRQSPYLGMINYDSINDFHYRFIHMNESVNDLLQESDLELASFIPEEMLNELNHHFNLLNRNLVIVFKVYAHDGLFVERNLLRIRKPFSKILSISIPGYEDQLPQNLPFILRNKSPADSVGIAKDLNTGCGYWNYSTWTSLGVETSNVLHRTNENELVLCYTNHLTQFSFLIGGGFKQNDLSDEILVTAVHQQALDWISLVGCTLSLMGLIGIWITAALFKSWRSQSSNKVLLNMCVALTLQMVLFLFVNTDDMSEELVAEHRYTKCVLLGAFLQYTLLVLFTWMLIIAFLQFQRYVTVIGIQRPKHYILKAAIAAWTIPLIPTLLVALLDAESYIPTAYQLEMDTGICYPSGNGLYFGVILPIALIVLANFTIFLYVFYSISHTLSMSLQRSEKQLVIKQIRLSILLFFLLGVSWIFGLFAFMKAGIAFSYLFCLTATMQGFVLFIYFVILDTNTRKAWKNLLCPQSSKKALDKKSSELKSMTTNSTSNTLDMSSTRDN